MLSITLAIDTVISKMRDPYAARSLPAEAFINPYNEIILEVFRLNGALIASGDALTKDLGLTSARWQVLGAIFLSPVPLPVAHIARNMGLTRQGVQRTVNGLGQADMVRFEDNPHHRRAVLILLTDKGKQAFLTALERQDRWMEIVNPALTLERIESASAVLRQFRTRLEQSSKVPDAGKAFDPTHSNPALPDGETDDRR